MKYLRQIVLILTLLFGVAVPGHATVLVSNVWNTGVRTYPAYNDTNSPYSEMGVDYNASGDFESAWFMGGYATATVAPGHLTLESHQQQFVGLVHDLFHNRNESGHLGRRRRSA